MNLLLIPPFLCTVVALTLSGFVFSKNPRSPVHRSLSLLWLEAGSWQICWFASYFFADPAHKDLIMRIAYIIITFLPVTYYHYAVRFLGKDEEWPFVRMGYLIGLVVFIPLLWTTKLYIVGYIDHWWGYYPRVGVLHPIYLTISLSSIARALFILRTGTVDPKVTPAQRNRNRFAFYAHLVCSFAAFEYAITYDAIEIYPVGIFALLGGFGITSYAIVRHRLLDIHLALTRTTVFAAVYALALGVPLLAALAWRPQLEQFLGTNWWVGLWIVCAALTTAAHYANQYFQKRAEKRLLAEQHRYQGTLRRASQGMTLVKELDKLLERTVRIITREVRLAHAAVYLWDERAKRFLPKASRHWKAAKPPVFSEKDPLVEYFKRWRKGPLVTEELDFQARGDPTQTGLHKVVAALKSLDAAVLVPSFVNERCMGFLVLGQKRSGAIFTPDDLEVFQVLANQAGLAIENAIFYEELQRTQTDLFQTAKMASLGHMAGGMSHQANNRFYVLSTLGGVLKAKLKELGPNPLAIPPETLQAFWTQCKDFAERVENNAIRGGDIVKTILKFSRPSGEYKPITIPQVIATAHDVAQFRVDLNQLEWKEAFPENLAYINGDLNQLADCTLNMITNASDAIRKKAELLKKHELPVNPEDPVPFKGELIFRGRLEKDKDGKHWSVLEVKDNGVGMTPQELENLFIPFFTTKATAQKGTGLGLFVIRRIIEQHGGAVNVSSSYGIGTTFMIRLPAL